jgi:hypothetical protein
MLGSTQEAVKAGTRNPGKAQVELDVRPPPCCNARSNFVAGRFDLGQNDCTVRALRQPQKNSLRRERNGMPMRMPIHPVRLGFCVSGAGI